MTVFTAFPTFDKKYNYKQSYNAWLHCIYDVNGNCLDDYRLMCSTTTSKQTKPCQQSSVSWARMRC